MDTQRSWVEFTTTPGGGFDFHGHVFPEDLDRVAEAMDPETRAEVESTDYESAGSMVVTLGILAEFGLFR